MSAALIVLAKAPAAGRSKTRLCPPCTPSQAARLAEAALRDTLATALATPAARHVLVLDGAPGPWLAPGFELISQHGGGLADRLAAAFADVGGPALLIGMDTPQVTTALLARGLAALDVGARSVLGPAADGGYWAIGLQRPDSLVFTGIPMSAGDTGAAQLARLVALGLSPLQLPVLRDVDLFADALAAADDAPSSRFAAALAAIEPDLAAAA